MQKLKLLPAIWLFTSFSLNAQTWTQAHPASAPGANSYVRMAYDAMRQQVVLFSGATWLWDGANWSPPIYGNLMARDCPGLAYDELRRQIVLFGGRDYNGAYLGDTWVWDGATWSQKFPLHSPSPRTCAAMAYDGARSQLVLFGGTLASPATPAETWIWDGTDWTKAMPLHSPPSDTSGKCCAAMAYYPGTQKIVLFGGGAWAFAGSTWEWDGHDWTQSSPAAAPSPRIHSAAVYDAALDKVLLFGGQTASGYSDETWQWDGHNWTRLSLLPAPYTRMAHAMAYDAARQRIVLFGGAGPSGPHKLGDTWLFGGTAPPPPPAGSPVWSPANPATVPPGLDTAVMAYDAVRQQVVMFGGPIPWNGYTWIWNGADWAQANTPGPVPPYLYYAGMAYDAARKNMVLVGGAGPNYPYYSADTWLWDGVSWTHKSPQVNGPYLPACGAVYDSARQQVVMFEETNGRTWLWDGANWSPANSLHSPSPRRRCHMAYHAGTQRVVVFGGEATVGPTVPLNDTWEWDGHDWKQALSATAPPPRVGASMAYDSSRDKIVLFGGLLGWQTTFQDNDTWEWDGHNWTYISPLLSPFGRAWHSMAYDAARQQMVLFGGWDYPTGLRDTWLYGAASTPPTDTTPPITTALASPSPNAGGWNNTNVAVGLTSTDNSGGSGVKQIEYSLSGAQTGGQTVPGNSASIAVSAEGATTLSYSATDNAGNRETARTLTVRIDKTTPVISGLPASGCTLTPVDTKLVQVATVTATDALSGLTSFSVTATSSEPGRWQDADIYISGTGLGPRVVKLRADRSPGGVGRTYTLTATAADLAGNSVTTTATCSVPPPPGADLVAPTSTASASPAADANGWNKTNVTVTLTATDNSGGSGVKQIQYALSGAQTAGPVNVAGSSAAVTIAAGGTTTLTWFATDMAGNAEAAHTLTIRIDKTPPVVAGMPAAGCTLLPVNQQMIQVASVTATDALTGLAAFDVKATSSEPGRFTDPDIRITGSGSQPRVVWLRADRLTTDRPRTYTITVTAADAAGNAATAIATCTVPLN